MDDDHFVTYYVLDNTNEPEDPLQDQVYRLIAFLLVVVLPAAICMLVWHILNRI